RHSVPPPARQPQRLILEHREHRGDLPGVRLSGTPAADGLGGVLPASDARRRAAFGAQGKSSAAAAWTGPLADCASARASVALSGSSESSVVTAESSADRNGPGGAEPAACRTAMSPDSPV